MRQPPEHKSDAPHQRRAVRAENKTGMPDKLKNGLETLSGASFDDVRVHYNSQKPKHLQAHAYAQGGDIYIAPGREDTLPHEAWHVAQQKRSKMRANLSFGGAEINDDPTFEAEATLMGERAVRTNAASPDAPLASAPISSNTVQRWGFENLGFPEDRGHDLILKSAVDLANQRLAQLPPAPQPGGVVPGPFQGAMAAPNPLPAPNPFQGAAAGGGPAQYTEEQINQLHEGNFINDLGPTSIDDSEHKGLANKIRSLTFGGAYLLKNTFSHESHKGSMQYLHSMKSTTDQTPEDTRTKLLTFADFAYRMSSADAATLNTPIDDFITDNQAQFANGQTDKDYSTLGFQNLIKLRIMGKSTIGDLVGLDNVDAENQDAAQMRFLGMLAHTMQDSFASSHALRGFVPTEADVPTAADNPAVENAHVALTGVSPIIGFTDYTGQDTGKHHTGDVLHGADRADVEDLQRVEDTAAARQARNLTAHLLIARKQRKTSAEMSGFFENAFRLAPSAQAQPQQIQQPPASGRAYRKQELAQSGDVGDTGGLHHVLTQYSASVDAHDRGPNELRQKSGQERFDELQVQLTMLRDSHERAVQGGKADAARKIKEDAAEIALHMESIGHYAPALQDSVDAELGATYGANNILGARPPALFPPLQNVPLPPPAPAQHLVDLIGAGFEEVFQDF